MTDASHPHINRQALALSAAIGVVLIILILFVAPRTHASLDQLRSSNVRRLRRRLSPLRQGGSTSTTVPKNKVPCSRNVRACPDSPVPNPTTRSAQLGRTSQVTVQGDRDHHLLQPGFLGGPRDRGEIKVSSSAIQPLNGLNPFRASGDDVIVILARTSRSRMITPGVAGHLESASARARRRRPLS